MEVLSGMRFGEFLQQRIFGPLNMTDSSFTIAADSVSRLAQIYSPRGVRGGNFFAPATGPGLDVAPPEVSIRYLEGGAFESGGGGLLSTARDYMRFAQMLLNGGELDGVRLLSPKTIALMTIKPHGQVT